MTARGTEKVPWAENANDGGKDHEPGSQLVSAAVVREPPGSDRPRSLFGAIKQLFRAVAKAVTTHPTPKPKRRRKRDEDTRGLFKKLAMKILAPVMRSIFHHDDFNCFTPPDELDETQRLLMREQHSRYALWQHDHNHASDYDQSNHLSPRL